jgi:hypothetical protein
VVQSLCGHFRRSRFLHVNRVQISRSHPFGKGRGSCTCDLASEGPVASEGVEAVLNEPTSLNRGEGLVSGLMGEVGGREGEREGGGGSGGKKE